MSECARCKRQVGETQARCPNCGMVLISDGPIPPAQASWPGDPSAPVMPTTTESYDAGPSRSNGLLWLGVVVGALVFVIAAIVVLSMNRTVDEASTPATMDVPVPPPLPTTTTISPARRKAELDVLKQSSIAPPSSSGTELAATMTGRIGPAPIEPYFFVTGWHTEWTDGGATIEMNTLAFRDRAGVAGYAQRSRQNATASGNAMSAIPGLAGAFTLSKTANGETEVWAEAQRGTRYIIVVVHRADDPSAKAAELLQQQWNALP